MGESVDTSDANVALHVQYICLVIYQSVHRTHAILRKEDPDTQLFKISHMSTLR
jgi:hypothetical protein